MGGLIILFALIVSMALWGNYSSLHLVLLTAATILLGALGFADDYIKSIKKNKNGLSARFKFLCQTGVALVVALVLYYFPSTPSQVSTLYIPYINKPVIDLGWTWIVFAVIVINAGSNAVNITDGLDGLAVGLMIIVAATFGIITYITGNVKIADYLRIPYIVGVGELAVFLAALTGALLGFLWFNSNPASVFMGDTGSLALGGAMGIVAVMTKKEILLIILGGVFFVETLSVIIQVGYYKWKKKRVFRMAPIHHHFELLGWPEQKIVSRFWIIGIILALVCLTTLKIL